MDKPVTRCPRCGTLRQYPPGDPFCVPCHRQEKGDVPTMRRGEKRCRVPGCDAPAAFGAHLYAFTPTLPAPELIWLLDPDCPYLCVEHAVENQKWAVGPQYPHTNRARQPAITVYTTLADEPEPEPEKPARKRKT